MLVVIYLIFPVFEGLNQKLHYYTTNPIFGDFVRTKVERTMHTTGFDFKEMETVFQQKSEKVSKFLLIILIPSTALCFWALSYKKRKYFFDQMVFAAEVNSFFLCWSFLILPLLLTLFLKTYHVFAGSYLEFSDNIMGLISSIVVCCFVAVGSYRFYQFKKWYAVLFSVLFWFINFIIVQMIYKFILFNIVINIIH